MSKRLVKVQQPSKKDKNIILDALLKCRTIYDAIEGIDENALKRSVHQILNGFLDYDPHGNDRTLDEFLRSTHTVFRFAPAPSGELHIGHVVPVLLNMILSKINRDYGYRSNLIVRIDDTDPEHARVQTHSTIASSEDGKAEDVDIPDTSVNPDIMHTLSSFIDISNVTIYRSSEYTDRIVDAVIESIRIGHSYFYPDLSPQDQIKQQRADRVGSSYRDADRKSMITILDDMASGKVKGVIRARIDPTSDNGNLRDPVMIRTNETSHGVFELFPTYDLVCPILDLYDARRYSQDSSCTLLALRDANYYDRLDQYLWVQRALADCSLIRSVSVSSEGSEGSVSSVSSVSPVNPVNPVSLVSPVSSASETAMCTFSRIKMENTVLSKRKIKEFIESKVVSGWSDPRLFTIPGIVSRGVSIASLCNFYWIAEKMSLSNRTATETLESFFSLNDKVLCKTTTPILNRLNMHDITESYTIYETEVISYADTDADTSASAENKGTTNTVNPARTIGKFRIDLDQIIASNLGHFKLLPFDYAELNAPGNSVIHSKEYADLDSTIKEKFCIGTELQSGTIVKINNFKDDKAEQHYPGFYVIRYIDSGAKRLVLSSIS